MLMQVQLGLDVRPCRLTKSYRRFRHESSGMETTELKDFVLLESERERESVCVCVCDGNTVPWLIVTEEQLRL
jgi:hypothetical protein